MHLFTLDKHPKIINIRSAITEAVLIQVEFPIYSTLGERSIHFEVVTDDDAFNLPAHQSLLTPVLYFSQSTNAAFLRPVKVKLLLSETSFDGSYDIQRGNLDQDCEIKDDYCVIKSFSFCPIALIKDSLRHTVSDIICLLLKIELLRKNYVKSVHTSGHQKFFFCFTV